MKFDALLTNFVSKDLKHGKIPMLLGEPGIGKSSWTESLAISMQTKCFTLAVNQLADKADLTGARLVPTGINNNYKQVFYPHETIMDAVEYAETHARETPILFLDEINRTTSDVTSAALSIPTMRRIGSVKLPINLLVMIAGNDKGNITSLDEASISRFVLYHVEPDTKTFLELDQTLNPYIKNVLTKNPDLIFCKTVSATVAAAAPTSGKNKKDDDEDEVFTIDDILTDGEGMQQISTPRTIAGLSDWLNEFDKNEIIQLIATPTVVNGMQTSVLMEGIMNHTGYTNFSIALESEIYTNINTMQGNTNTKTPRMPNCYNTLKQQPDINALQAYVAGMNENELSACIVYAIYEKVDNRIILLELVKNANKIDPTDMSALMNLVANDDYDKENWNVVTASGSKIGVVLEIYSGT